MVARFGGARYLKLHTDNRAAHSSPAWGVAAPRREQQKYLDDRVLLRQMALERGAVRGAMLVVCGGIAAATFVAMYRAIWSTRNDPARVSAFRQSIVSELFWSTIPLLMLLAAAFPAVMAMISGGRH
jgi:hypothetical protein